MKRKYEIKFEKDNIFISRNFPEIKKTIRRVVLNCSNWKSLVSLAKRDILREAQQEVKMLKKGGKNVKI